MLRRQVFFCYEHLQKELDMLHDQLHREIAAAVRQEVAVVDHRLADSKRETAVEVWEVFEHNLSPLRDGLSELREEVEKQARQLRETVQKKQMQRQRALDTLGAQDEAREAAEEAVREVMQSRLHEVTERAVREATKAAQAAAAEAAAKVSNGWREPLSVVEVKVSQFDGAEKRLTNELKSLRGDISGVTSSIDDMKDAVEEAVEEVQRVWEQSQDSVEDLRKEVQESTSTLRKEIQDSAEEVRKKMQAAASVLEDASEDVRREVEDMRQDLQGEVAAREAQHLQAAQVTGSVLAQLEQRVNELSHSLGEHANKVSLQAPESTDENFRASASSTLPLDAELQTRLDDVQDRLEDLERDCREGLGAAQSCCVRSVEWRPNVDLELLERTGSLSLESPTFACAGVSGLRLRLVVSAGVSQMGFRAWSCGAFLQAEDGRLTFRLAIVGFASQVLSGDFSATAREVGSQRIATVDDLEPEKVAVRVEMLEIAGVSAAGSWPRELGAFVQLTDAQHTVQREVSAFRSSMVRRVEWRLTRVPERVERAKAAASIEGDEAYEPILSPIFAAGGVENLQLQLYPVGYRNRADDQCGFFLICPRGVYMKCRAFIGDQGRMFEHAYGIREPFGRGSFCRLEDKVDADGCVVCGIEILEVRQDFVTQAKSSPPGMADQLKITRSPGAAGMEIVRELGDPQDFGEHRRRPPKGGKRAQPRDVPVGVSNSPIGVSKSLPVLATVGHGKSKAQALGHYPPGIKAYAAALPRIQ